MVEVARARSMRASSIASRQSETDAGVFFDDSSKNVTRAEQIARSDLRAVQVPLSTWVTKPPTREQHRRLLAMYKDAMLEQGEMLAFAPLEKIINLPLKNQFWGLRFFDPASGVTLDMLDEAQLQKGDALILDYDFTISMTAGFLTSANASFRDHTLSIVRRFPELTGIINENNVFAMYMGGIARAKMIRKFLKEHGLENVYVVTNNPAERLVRMMMTIIVGENFDNVYSVRGSKNAKIEEIMRKHHGETAAAAAGAVAGVKRGRSFSASL
tara:strand:+ start:14094 stop:14906 length:813 start_codon:yes stop_codon:yes gene_type:complete